MTKTAFLCLFCGRDLTATPDGQGWEPCQDPDQAHTPRPIALAEFRAEVRTVDDDPIEKSV